MKKFKIGIALSGGIDSTLVAFLLKKNNFYLESFFMTNWNFMKESRCNSKIDKLNALNTAKTLNIKMHLLDFSNNYWNSVFTVFLKELMIGKTPNPDVLCNKEIKFNILILYIIKKLNFDFLATGHYCCLKKEKNNIFIQESFDTKKDQTYFLNQIKPLVKKKIIFPLSNYSKNFIRTLTKKYLLDNFNKKSSTGICFIGENNFFKFISNYLNNKIGIVINNNNLILGYHYGLHLYTVGQKKNINYTYKSKLSSKLYIYKKNVKDNILYVTENKKNLMFCRKLIIKNINFLVNKSNKFICDVKFKHGIDRIPCLVKKVENLNKYKIYLKYPKKILAVGQYSVFYNKKKCIGGSYILDVLNEFKK